MKTKFLVAAATLLALLGGWRQAAGQTFQNTGTISINDNAPANPYPSTIVVSGLSEHIASITVSLVGLSHTFPDDIDILLVAPSGEAVMLMSDSGGGFDVSSVTLTFMDGAPSLPDDAQISSGMYSPSDYDGQEAMPAPAPSGPYGSALSNFAGSDGNGTWSLYVRDDTGIDVGLIAGGWRITIVQEPPQPPVTYQGRLSRTGSPLNGDADLRFSLFNAQANGTQVFPTIDVNGVTVADGLFTVELPFSSTVFDGGERWLEIAARSPAGSGIFTTLSPRQRIAPAPEATHARHATDALVAAFADTAGNADIAQTALTLSAPSGGPADVVIVSETGNVGIGTQTPARRLEILDTQAIARLTTNNSLNGSSLELRNNTDTQTILGRISFLSSSGSTRGQVAYRGADESMTFFANALERVRIDSVGNVGIGTTNPERKLHVVDSQAFLRLTTSSSLSGSRLELRNINSDQSTLGALDFINSAGNIRGQVGYFGTGDFMSFATAAAERMRINSAGNVGIGTNAPARRLHVSNGISGGTSLSTVDLLVEDDSSCYINLMSPDASEHGIAFGSPANNVHGGIYYTNSTGMNLRTGGNQTAMVINALGNVAIGIPAGSNDAALHVQNATGGARPIKCDRVGNDGELLAWARDDTVVGTVTVAGGFVSYNAFTGSHYAWTDQPIERGMLVTLTGVNRRIHEDRESEIVYGIAPSSTANDSRCIGAYLGVQDPSRPAGPDNPHLIMSVGNGDMWVVDGGTDILPGDDLMASGVAGCAMKADRIKVPVTHIVARAAEGVRWSDVPPDKNGTRRVRISVLLDRFTRGADPATVADLVARLDALQQDNAAMRARLDRLEREHDDLRNSRARSQRVSPR